MTSQPEFRIYMKAIGSKSAEAVTRHLSETELIALYQEQLPPAECETGKTHVAQCPECLQRWRDVRDFYAPAEAEEAEASEFELRREWKELWGQIQTDRPAVTPVAPAVTRHGFFTPRASLGLAAGVMLTVSLSTVTLFWRQERRDRLQAQETVARLQTAQQDLMSRVSQLEQTGQAQPQFDEQLKLEREKRLELETRLAEFNQPQTNIPTYQLMLAGKERGNDPSGQATYEISVPASATHYLLEITPDSPEDFTAYVIEVFDRQNRVAWKSEKLKPKAESLVVTFPRTYLSEGTYRLRLTGWKEKTSKMIGEYDLKLNFARK